MSLHLLGQDQSYVVKTELGDLKISFQILVWRILKTNHFIKNVVWFLRALLIATADANQENLEGQPNSYGEPRKTRTS